MHNVPEGPGLPVCLLIILMKMKSALIKFTNDPKLSRGVSSQNDGFIR